MKNFLLLFILTLGIGLANPVAAQSLATASFKENLPREHSGMTLRANYPNPFHDQTVIGFSIAKPQQVKITLFNVLGSQISTLLNDQVEAGDHEITYKKPDNLPDGIYIYTIEAGTTSRSMRMIIRK